MSQEFSQALLSAAIVAKDVALDDQRDVLLKSIASGTTWEGVPQIMGSLQIAVALSAHVGVRPHEAALCLAIENPPTVKQSKVPYAAYVPPRPDPLTAELNRLHGIGRLPLVARKYDGLLEYLRSQTVHRRAVYMEVVKLLLWARDQKELRPYLCLLSDAEITPSSKPSSASVAPPAA